MDNPKKIETELGTGYTSPATTTNVPEAAPVEKDTPTLQCVVCHNVDTPDGPLNRLNYPGYCGHCGGSFKVIK